MERGIVERVSNKDSWPLVGWDSRHTFWKLVKVKGRATPLIVHYNWFVKNGFLSAGDEIEFEPSKPIPYKAVEGADHVKNLSLVKRAGKEAILDE